MPQNGEAKKKFGVYRSVCCGAEIVINPGSRFPDCPNHPKLTTVWKPAAEEPVVRVMESKTATRPPIDVHIENRRLFNLAFGRITMEEWELSHLHVCRVCQGVLYVFVHQPLSPVPEDPGKRRDLA